MLRLIARTSALLGLALALAPRPALAQDVEWANKVRFLGSAGLNSTAVINFLTFREGEGNSGWNWQLTASYPLQPPYFVEGGLMGWTLGRTGADSVERFGITASGGIRFGGGNTEAGVGFVPGGGRVFLRHFLRSDGTGKGPMVQGSLVFPGTTGTRSFVEGSVGFGF